MRLALRAQVLVLVGLGGVSQYAAASEPLPVRVVRSSIVTCPQSGAVVAPARKAKSCLELHLRWNGRVGRSEKQETQVIYTGSEMVDEITSRFGLHASLAFDAITVYLGRRIQRRGKKKKLSQRALDHLFKAGLIRCHSLLDDVSLTAAIERRVAKLGCAYYREVGRPLVVTSGSRSPEAQASAMYRKLRLGVRLSKFYRSKAAREIEKAFLMEMERKTGRAAVIEAGAAVIRKQMARGIYISKHLLDDAVDIRSRNLSRREKALFRRLARELGFRVLLESRPPHFHLSVSNPEA